MDSQALTSAAHVAHAPEPQEKTVPVRKRSCFSEGREEGQVGRERRAQEKRRREKTKTRREDREEREGEGRRKREEEKGGESERS